MVDWDVDLLCSASFSFQQCVCSGIVLLGVQGDWHHLVFARWECEFFFFWPTFLLEKLGEGKDG